MEIKPIYLFYGEDRYLLYKDVAIFRDYFARDGVIAEDFDGTKVSLGSILAAAGEIPLFGGKRLIIVDRSPWFRKRKDEDEEEFPVSDEGNEELIAYAASPNTDTCLVFVANRVDKRMKAVKAIAECGTVREYALKKSYELPDYIRKYVKRYQKGISVKAIDTLLEYIGEDSGLIRNEIDKLILYIDDRDRIEADDVRRVVSRSAEATLFELSDEIGARHVKRVRKVVSAILERMKPNEYAMLFGYLVNYFRILIKTKELAEKHISENMLAKEIGIHPYRAKKAMAAVKHYSMSELAEAFHALLECDYKVKSGQWSYNDAIYITVMNIVSE